MRLRLFLIGMVGLSSGSFLTGGEQLVFPIVVALPGPTNGSEIQSTLIFENLSEEEIDLRPEAFENDGTERFLFGPPLIKLDPLGNDARTLFVGFNGWIRISVEAPGAIRSASVAISYSNEPCIVAFVSRTHDTGCLFDSSNRNLSYFSGNAIRPARQFWARAFLNSGNIQSAYAIVNPSDSETASVEMEVVDEDGALLGRTSFQVGPLKRVSKFLEELISLQSEEDDPQRIGRVYFRSASPIAVGAVGVWWPDAKLIDIPVQPLE